MNLSAAERAAPGGNLSRAALYLVVALLALACAAPPAARPAQPEPGAAVAGAPAGTASAAPAAPTVAEKPLASVVNVGPMGSNDLIVIADRLGFYRKHGLRAEVTPTSSTTVVQGLISGSFDVASTSAESFINANLEGADIAIIGQLSRALTTRLMVAPGIASAAQLRDTIGCTISIGGGSFMSMHHYLVTQGLEPGKDVTLVATGSSANNEAALRTGKCAFTVAGSDTAPRLEVDGMRLLYDFRGTPYPLAVVATTRAGAQADRERVHRFLRAITDAIAYVKTHPAEVIADLVARGMPDDDELRRAYDEGAANLSLPPVLDPAAQRNLIEWNAEYQPAYRDVVIDRHTDPTLMADLEREGFFRALGLAAP
jgi:ABC-type nitrate/sulfonate/bicarbonate transport system substrate-binding protein